MMAISVAKPIPAELNDNNIVVLGSLGKTYGIKGWLKVNSYTDPMSNIVDYKPLYFFIDNQWQVLEIEAIKAHGTSIIAKLVGCDNPEDARLYTGLKMGTPRSNLPTLDEGEYYWSDLQDLEVRTVEDQILGNVEYLFSTGANDVLVVKGEKERLVPFIREQVVKQVNLAEGSITVDWDPDF